jgi:hypothetical protein
MTKGQRTSVQASINHPPQPAIHKWTLESRLVLRFDLAQVFKRIKKWPQSLISVSPRLVPDHTNFLVESRRLVRGRHTEALQLQV